MFSIFADLVMFAESEESQACREGWPAEIVQPEIILFVDFQADYFPLAPVKIPLSFRK